MNFFSFRVLGKRIKAIRFMMKDKSVKWYKKALMVAGIIYLVLPIDIIPPVFGPIGVIDDFLFWVFILWYLSDELDRYWLGDKSVDLSKKYKNTVNDVNYTVEEDKGGPQSGS